MKNLKFTPFLLLAILAMGCAKERAFKNVPKEEVFTKSAFSIDPNDPYLYVPSVGETPMDVSASRAYALGQEKLVTFKFTQDRLIVEELPREERYSGNDSNFSPVMEFSIEHKDYRCKEDQFGKCSNEEEENKDIPWQRRRHAKINLTSLKVLETNTLPEQLTNVFTKCYGDGNLTVKEFKVEKDAINVHVQKTWTAGIQCADLQSFRDLRNMAFTVNYYYSFVKLSKIASPNYKAVDYPFEDQSSYGYFTTDVFRLTADNRTRDDWKKTFMNRWNPERGEIVYLLNDAFYKEGMESILSSTHQAVETINNSYARAGVDLKIRLEDGRGKDIGDLRNNFIILVEDPQASGVIGYGPSIANPRTGEIVKAQTVMYFGTIKKFISDTYDELVEEKQRNDSLLSNVNATVAARVPRTNGHAINETALDRTTAHRALITRMGATPSAMNNGLNTTRNRSNMSHSRMNSIDLSKEMFNPTRRIELSHWLDQLKNRENLSEAELARASLNEMSHRCFYHNEMFNWHDAVAPDLSADALGLEKLLPWNDLSEDEKEKVITKLMPNVWVPTLVHEIGHNLGLRHNFNGSEDKENYFTAQERSSMGIKREIPYSSVMDYAQKSLNQLPIMGKYDIAALRFGYARSVEKKDGSIMKLSSTDTLEKLKKENKKGDLREYQFCTDEHVEVNPGCNRFDEGSGLKAVAQSFVDTYNKNYEKRHFRNRRATFDTYGGDISHFLRSEYTFSSLRRFFELYDRLANMYPSAMNMNWDEEIANAPDDSTREIMQSNKDFFTGLQDAVKVAADFYLDVLTTPDLHCAVFNTQTNQLQAIVPLSNFTMDAPSCFSEKVQLREPFVVVGQTGKFFDNRRFSEDLPGDLVADPSQISIRGIWMDKILAIDSLTKRVLGISTFDDYRGNFLDYPVFGDRVREVVTSFLNDSIEIEANFTMIDGSTQKVPHTFEIGKTHEFKRSMHPTLNRYLGITKVITDFRELMIPMVKSSLNQADDEMANWGLKNALGVIRVTPGWSIDQGQVAKTTVFRDEKGLEVARFTATHANTIAQEYMTQRESRQTLEKFERDALIQVYLARAQDQVPEEIPAELAQVYAMDLDILLAYLQGVLPDDEFYLKMLLVLSK